jgi:iron complex outermembrane receptor protein
VAVRAGLTAIVLAAAPSVANADEPPGARAVLVTAPSPRWPAPSIAGPLNERIEEVPAQITVIPSEVLHQAGVHRPSDALYVDPSVGENYPAIGYYENFSIRGFTLDQGSAYRINGFVVPGELNIALDNKERIEIFKGIGLSSGAASPGGLVNFVTRRPDDVAGARLELSQFGGRYAGFDLGRARGAGSGLGYRINVAHEEMRPYVAHADGHRTFLGAGLDAAPDRSWLITADLEVQQQSQFAVPGFQLLGGTTLPDNRPGVNINQQPWSRPVENDGLFAAVRAAYEATPDWKVSFGAGQGLARISDNLAFPFGCNDAPVQYFCADGSYVLYDYHAKELRKTTHVSGTVSGDLRSGEYAHRVAFGGERIARRVSQREVYSTTLLDAAGRGATGSLDDPGAPLPAPSGVPVDRPAASADQVGFFVGDRIAWHAWEAQATVRQVRIRQRPTDQEPNSYLLPQLALIRNFGRHARLYASVATGVEFGSEAPLTAENAGQLLLPRRTRTAEAGWKQQAERYSIAAAAFTMRRPYEFTASAGSSFAGLGAYHRAGTEVHNGFELSAAAAASNALRLGGSVAVLSARASDTGEPSLDGVQVQNIPRVRSNLNGRYRIDDVPGLEVSASWFHSAARNARRDGLVSVPGYDRIDAGISFTPVSYQVRSTFTLRVINLANRRYWRDVSEAYSADLLFPGAPRQIWVGLLVQDVP